MNANLFIDTHVHIYPEFTLDLVLETIERRAIAVAGKSCRSAVLCLADRNGFEAWPTLIRKSVSGEDSGGFKFSHEANASESLIIRARRGDFEITILRGKQWVSHERIEVLGLGTELALPDGLGTGKIISEVMQSSGLAVIPWSLGKWAGDRRAAVESVMRTFRPGEIAFGDISMRALTSSKSLLEECRRRGFSILPGSDPLPMPGEEKAVGDYGIVASMDDGAPTVSSLLELMRHPSDRWRVVGKRNGLLKAAIRWITLTARTKKGRPQIA